MNIYHNYKNNNHHIIHLNKGIKLSSTIIFNKKIKGLYDTEYAKSTPLNYNGLSKASVRDGGSCNADQITLIPHCHGTHTECVGHISDEKIDLAYHCDLPLLMYSTFIKVKATPFSRCKESYTTCASAHDSVITKLEIEKSLDKYELDLSDAIIIKTLHESHLDSTIPPYMTHEAMQLLIDLNFKHLIIDIPSIDRIYDDGQLLNHKIFWGAQDKLSLRDNCTITEMACIADHIPSKNYYVSIHLPDLEGDALPSRPILYPFSLEC